MKQGVCACKDLRARVWRQTMRLPTPSPKSTSRGEVHGGASTEEPRTSVNTGWQSNRNVALTMVAPALPVPAVKKLRSTTSPSHGADCSGPSLKVTENVSVALLVTSVESAAISRNFSTDAAAINAEAPGQIPAPETATLKVCSTRVISFKKKKKWRNNQDTAQYIR